MSKSPTEISPLRPSQIQLAQHAYRMHAAIITVGIRAADILKNAKFWSLCGRDLKYGDEIRTLSEDGSYMAKFFVNFADGNNISVVLLSETDLEVNDIKVAAEYEIKLCGPKKFCIQRVADGSIVKEGIDTKLAAERELADYTRALRA